MISDHLLAQTTTVLPSISVKTEAVTPGTPGANANSRKVVIGVVSPLPAGKTPCKAEIIVTEPGGNVSTIGPDATTVLNPKPGDPTEGTVVRSVQPIPNGTKIKITVKIRDKDGNVIGIISDKEYEVGTAGVIKFGPNPMDFPESDDMELPPPPPPPA